MPARRQAIIWTNDGWFTDASMCHSASMSEALMNSKPLLVLVMAWCWRRLGTLDTHSYAGNYFGGINTYDKHAATAPKWIYRPSCGEYRWPSCGYNSITVLGSPIRYTLVWPLCRPWYFSNFYNNFSVCILNEICYHIYILTNKISIFPFL